MDMTLQAVYDWISARVAEGCRIVAVDPITAAATSARPWEADQQFVTRCKTLASRSGASIVLVTHPRGLAANAPPDADSMAGGRAYGRFTDCCLWLQSHNPPKEGKIRTALGDTDMEYDRTLTLTKTRDGNGQGLSIAFKWHGDRLSLTELGAILPQKKRKAKDD